MKDQDDNYVNSVADSTTPSAEAAATPPFQEGSFADSVPDEKFLEDARELYLKYGGGRHELIVREMRERGWAFYRNMLYTRRRSGGIVKGLPELHGWRELLTSEKPRTKTERAIDGQFEVWLKEAFPEWKWNWKYQRYVYERLSRLTTGKSNRLMIFMPPRHGKSEMVTVRYTAWRLLQDPKLNVILGSYNQKLANKFSRKIKRIVQDPRSALPPRPRNAATPPNQGGEFNDPRGVLPPRPRNAATPPNQGGGVFPSLLNTTSEWETSGGGVVRSVGVGAGIAGFGGGLIVIDDPVRNRADAESETFRDKVWDWFNDDIYTRLEPNASIILIQTRWHEDDLAGRLLKEQEDGGEKWEVIKLPAIAEEEDDIGRKPGQALCPARYNIAALEKTKRKLGSYSFSSLISRIRFRLWAEHLSERGSKILSTRRRQI